MNKTYANVAAIFLPKTTNTNTDNNTLEEMKTTDLDLFLKIITLIQKLTLLLSAQTIWIEPK